MFDAELVKEILGQILIATDRIQQRFATIRQPGDFTDSEEGLMRLDGIGMMLITIGESLKNLDKRAADMLLRYPQVDWIGAKGLEDLDVPLKLRRLRQWCEDLNRAQSAVKYDFVFVDQESFEKYKPATFRQLIDGFKEYKENA